MYKPERLLHYWGHREGAEILSMPRTAWCTVVGSLGTPVAFDVRSTPMASMGTAAQVIGALVHEITPATAKYSIYRNDPADHPTPINQDDFAVYTDLSVHPDLDKLIHAASTEDNDKLRDYIQQHVFFVKQKPGKDHWQATIPSSVMVVLNSTARST